MKDRKKAQEIFNDTNFVFSAKGTFQEAFPTIEKIAVTVVESGHGIKEWNKERKYSQGTLSEYVDCTNPSCYGGGFRIGEIVRKMVTAKETTYANTEFCKGYEGTKTKKRRSCINRFKVTIELKFKG